VANRVIFLLNTRKVDPFVAGMSKITSARQSQELVNISNQRFLRGSEATVTIAVWGMCPPALDMPFLWLKASPRYKYRSLWVQDQSFGRRSIGTFFRGRHFRSIPIEACYNTVRGGFLNVIQGENAYLGEDSYRS
jgi:hypothetical protein